MRRAKLAQNLLLLVGRTHAAELRNEFSDRVSCCRVARSLLLIAGDQRPGIALELLQAVPVRRGRVAGPVFGPVRIGGGMTDSVLPSTTKSQREMRIDPNELLEQFANLIGVDRPCHVRPEHRYRVPVVTRERLRMFLTIGSCLI